MESTAVKKPIYLTHIMIGINVAIFVFMSLYDFSMSVPTLIQFGAKYNVAIADGELWRLLTSMFLHANLMHITFNSLALHALGRDVEIFFGKAKFLIIYFVAGLFGSIGSFLLNDAVGVGASGAIFGLLGANLYLLWLNPPLYKRIYGTNMLVLIGINLVYGFMVPNIDNVAHLTGLVGGFLAAMAIGVKQELPKSWRHLGTQALILVIAVSALAFGVPNYKSSWRYDYNKAVDLMDQGKLEEARAFLVEGQKKRPDIPNFEYWIERIDYVTGRSDETENEEQNGND